MSYSYSASIVSQADLMAQVSTFAVARGWTEDNYDVVNKKMSLHKGSCYVHFLWDDTSALSASTGKSIGMYQSLGYISAGTDSWAHTDDSQNGANATSLLNQERGIKNIGDGPYTSLSMHGFTDTDVVYCILEIAPGIYRHFGFGNIVKSGSWTGGEWAAGHHWTPEAAGDQFHQPSSVYHNILLDGVNYGFYSTYLSAKRVAGTVHVEGLPGQTTENSKWGVVGRGTSLTTSTYREGRDGNDRAPISGGFRDSFNIQQMGWLSPDVAQGYVPVIPCDLYYYDFNATQSEHLYYLGRMHNIGMCQMTGIDPQQVLTIGADEWVAYPGVRKSKTGVSGTQETWNMGIIYKK